VVVVVEVTKVEVDLVVAVHEDGESAMTGRRANALAVLNAGSLMEPRVLRAARAAMVAVSEGRGEVEEATAASVVVAVHGDGESAMTGRRVSALAALIAGSPTEMLAREAAVEVVDVEVEIVPPGQRACATTSKKVVATAARAAASLTLTLMPATLRQLAVTSIR